MNRAVKKFCLLSAAVLMLASVAALAQDAAPAGQPPDQGSGGWQGQEQRPMGPGPAETGIIGIVTEAAADHYVIKTDAGDTYTVRFSGKTRMMKDAAQRSESGEGRPPAPQTLASADIKAGDEIAVNGETDTAAKSVDAAFIVQLNPEHAKKMREMRASYGKTWLMGRVTAISGTTVTLMGMVDNAAHAFVADENTSFRKRRESIALTDIKAGDMVRAEGAVKNGTFVAASVSVMGMPPGGMPGARPE